MLEKIESFAVSAPYEMLKASPLEIGSCIQQWSLGTRCRCENGSISFEAGTNRHSYTFNIEPGSSIAGPPAYGSTNAADSSRRTSA